MSEFPQHEDRISEVIKRMVMHPTTMFFGLFMAEVPWRVAKVPGIDTACLMTHEQTGGAQMVFNPDFMDSIDLNDKKLPEHAKEYKELTFLVRHELEHNISMHYIFRRDFGWEPTLSNLATDCFINDRQIKEGEQQKQSGYKYAMEMPKDEKGKIVGIYSGSYPELKLESCRESQYYYDAFSQAKRDKQNSAGRGEDSKAGPKGNQRGTSGSELLDAQLDNEEDIHAAWEEIGKGMSETERKIAARELIKRIERVAEETEKQKGTVPMDIKSQLERIAATEPPVITWNQVLRRFMGSALSTEILVNKKRPSRRFPDAFATKFKQKVSMVCCVDSSGSVSDDELMRLNAEIHHIWKAGANSNYFAWDETCGEIREYKGTLNFERVKCGGTNMSAAIKHVNTNYQKYGWCCAVVESDGFVPPVTEKCRIPMLIVITPNGTTEFDNPYGYKVVKMN